MPDKFKWIACEDQLPEEEDCFLVTWKDSRKIGPFYQLCYYHPEQGWEQIPQARGEFEVLAWAPLPELYREEEE